MSDPAFTFIDVAEIVLGGIGTLGALTLSIIAYRQKRRLDDIERSWKVESEIVIQKAGAFASEEHKYISKFEDGVSKLLGEVNICRELLRDISKKNGHKRGIDTIIALARLRASQDTIRMLYGALHARLRRTSLPFDTSLHAIKQEIGKAIEAIGSNTGKTITLHFSARESIQRVLDLWPEIENGPGP